MFSIKALTALAIAMATATLAAPTAAADSAQAEFEAAKTGGLVNDSESSMVKRTVGGVYICTDANWKGQCGYAVQPLNERIKLDFPWYHSISSFGPDVGTACTWYSDYNCNNVLATRVGNPGIPDLSTWDSGAANDQIGSFICYNSN